MCEEVVCALDPLKTGLVQEAEKSCNIKKVHDISSLVSFQKKDKYVMFEDTILLIYGFGSTLM